MGADEGDWSFFVPELAWWPLVPELLLFELPVPELLVPEDELLVGVETLAWVDVTPGSVKAIPAAAITLAVVADTATARTRAWPRFLAPTSRLLGFMSLRIAGVLLANRSESSESALKARSSTVRL